MFTVSRVICPSGLLDQQRRHAYGLQALPSPSGINIIIDFNRVCTHRRSGQKKSLGNYYRTMAVPAVPR